MNRKQAETESMDMPAAPVRAMDISEVLAGVARRRRLILGFTLLFALAGTLFALLARPVYTSESQVLIEYQETPYLRSIAAQQTQPRRVDDRDVKSQVAVIESRDLALKVLRELDLIGTPEFDPLKEGLGLGTRLKILLGFKADPRRLTPEQRALRIWYENLRVYDLPGSRVVVISYTSPSPKTAARIVNALAEAYVEQTRAAQLARTSEAREWLKKQIEELRRKVVESEVAVERYRARAGLYKGTQAKLINQELTELSTQITNAAAERSRAEAEARAIREMIRKTGTVDNSPAVLRSPLIQRLREQQIGLERRLAELSTIYLDNHPRVKATRRELADLKAQIRREALKIARSLEQQARIAAAREAELRAALDRLKKRASTASVEEVRLRELEREAKANRALLETFLTRYSEAATRDQAEALPGMARVISRGGVPGEPSFPRRGPIILLSALAGLGLGLGVAFILEVMGASARLARAARAQAARSPLPEKAATADGGGQAPEKARMPADAQAAAGSAAERLTEPAARPAFGGGGATWPQASPAGGPAVASTTMTMAPAAAPQAAVMSQAASRPAETGPSRNAAPATGAGNGTDAAANRSLASRAGEGDVRPRPQERPPVFLPQVIDLHSADATGHDPALEPMLTWLRDLHEREGVRRLGVAALGGGGLASAALSAGLARALARAGLRVSLVDADFESRRLSSVVVAQRRKGLADVIAGRASFAEVMARDAASPLHVIQAGGSLPQGDVSASLKAVMEAMEQVYDMVVVHEGEARYPARRETSMLPHVQAAFVVTPHGQEAVAESLCAALGKAGVRHCRTVALWMQGLTRERAVAGPA
jgi:uncharacterized protein involved in exopolysaccharide biosynthesis